MKRRIFYEDNYDNTVGYIERINAANEMCTVDALREQYGNYCSFQSNFYSPGMTIGEDGSSEYKILEYFEDEL
jgi:hypothetical protein